MSVNRCFLPPLKNKLDASIKQTATQQSEFILLYYSPRTRRSPERCMQKLVTFNNAAYIWTRTLRTICQRTRCAAADANKGTFEITIKLGHVCKQK